MARKVQEWSEQEFVKNRLNVWYGSAMPRTVGAKELVDNAIDQMMDGLATKIEVRIGKNKIAVLDNGKGVSLNTDTASGKTHLFTAFNKLYSSSNYGGSENTAGTNGVGASVSNFISDEFKAGILTGNKFKGYIWNDGINKNDGNSFDYTEIDNPNDMKFYVEANYSEKYTTDDINIGWMLNYTKARFAESKIGSQLIWIEEGYDPQIYERVSEETKNRTEFQLISWLDTAEELGLTIIQNKDYTYAFSEDPKNKVTLRNMVQGAPVNNVNTRYVEFKVSSNETTRIGVPASFYYKSKKNPSYTDQTKAMVVLRYKDFEEALMKKAPEAYEKYKKLAIDAYLKKAVNSTDTGFYWPALGNDDVELIIAEGYSAISGIKSKRNPQTQACLGLRGKILNVLGRSLKDSLKSDIIMELFSIIKATDFKRIIIATDADVHGSHITGLLIVLFHKFFPELLKNGKIIYCNTPKYTFRKGDDLKWSDKEEDCPKGYKVHVLKGLGAMNQDEIEYFIINESTRDTVQIVPDEGIDERLQFSYGTGARDWVIEDEPSKDYLNVMNKKYEDCLYE